MTAGADHFGAPDPRATPDLRATTERLMTLGRHLAATSGGAPIEIATTPKDEIWRDGKIRLYRYRPVADGGPKLGPPLSRNPFCITGRLIWTGIFTGAAAYSGTSRVLAAAMVDATPASLSRCWAQMLRWR